MKRLVWALAEVALVVLSATVSAEPPEAAQVHFNAGFAAMGANDFEKAIAELKQAIELDKDYLEAHWVLGWAYSLNGDKASAAEQYREVIRLAPDSGRAREAQAALERLEPSTSPGAAAAGTTSERQMQALRLLGEPIAVETQLLLGPGPPINAPAVMQQCLSTAEKLMLNRNLADGLPAAAQQIARLAVGRDLNVQIVASCRNHVAPEEIVTILGSPVSQEAGYPWNFGVFTGQWASTGTWYDYGWLQFGVRGDQVLLVRADCARFAGISTSATESAADASPRERQETGAGQEIVGPDGGKMVLVPPGEFTMGVHPTITAILLHRVRITKGFWLGKCTVTNAQYRRYCEAAGMPLPEGGDQGDDHPVVNVKWADAVGYCKFYGMQLPTEAQWEYAARGPRNRKYPWGWVWDPMKCCNIDNKGPEGGTCPVGSFPEGASWCGALDMAGNAYQWCQDAFDPDYYKVSPVDDPPGPGSGDDHVQRGGSCDGNSDTCRSSSRFRASDTDKCGFRCVWMPDAGSSAAAQSVGQQTKPGERPSAATRTEDTTELLSLSVSPTGDGYEATVRFKGRLPTEEDLRIIYLVEEAATGIGDITQVAPSGTVTLKVDYPRGWTSEGGTLMRRGKYIGFQVDVHPHPVWTEVASGMINIPLKSPPLLEGMSLGEPGRILVAFVAYAEDGNHKNARTNTVSASFVPRKGTKP